MSGVTLYINILFIKIIVNKYLLINDVFSAMSFDNKGSRRFVRGRGGRVNIYGSMEEKGK